jgi:hypothetical protein
MTPKTLELPNVSENGSAPDFSNLDDFFAAVPRPQESKVIGGRMCYFEGGSPEDRDNVIAAHSQEDEEGKTKVSDKGWRTNVIAKTWVAKFGGPKVLEDHKAREKFYKTIPAQIEQEMYEVAARVFGIASTKAEAEKRRKNSDGTATSSTSPSSA